MELRPQSHNRDGLSVPNSVMVVYMDPLGYIGLRSLGLIGVSVLAGLQEALLSFVLYF